MRTTALLAFLLVLPTCKPKPTGTEPATSASAPPIASASAPEKVRIKAEVHEGGALARAIENDALYVADEDHKSLRVIALPLGDTPSAKEIAMPGAPAEVLALDGEVLVTVRDPGLLLIMKRDATAGLVEDKRVELPADAWGIAVTPDEKTALVTSAWTHQVSAIDLASGKKTWSIDVAREPRAVVVRADGHGAYVTHLVGSAITRIDDLAKPEAKRVELPPYPLRAPLDGETIDASLAYSAVLSPDGRRLFVARHALGAGGEASWFGTNTVDVLLTQSDTPLAPARRKALVSGMNENAEGLSTPIQTFVQPRAMVYRKSTRTLIIASEGNGTIAEVDALAIDPAAAVFEGTTPFDDPPVNRIYSAGKVFTEVTPICGAPTGLALAKDEQSAFVYCRSSGDLAEVRLALPALGGTKPEVKLAHLADDKLAGEAAQGRKLFYDATDTLVSGGLGCAGCHPEGRDDGHVWREVIGRDTREPIFVGARSIAGNGRPRQTPMLAGRVSAEGPYGWQAQNADLGERVREGMHLHRWQPPSRPWNEADGDIKKRSAALAAFLRKGLVPPPREKRDLTAAEQRGQELFKSTETGCAGCHVPETDYTNRLPIALRDMNVSEGYEDDPKKEFKTPSLLFVGGTAPYFHDGRVKTLEQMIDQNDDRMGKTKQLSPEDRAALVSYLRTL